MRDMTWERFSGVKTSMGEDSRLGDARCKRRSCGPALAWSLRHALQDSYKELAGSMRSPGLD
jgi:hypothetical protein